MDESLQEILSKIKKLDLSFFDYDKKSYRSLNQTELMKLATVCHSFDLDPAVHTVMYSGNVYINWIGTKKLLRDNGIYWTVEDEEVSKLTNKDNQDIGISVNVKLRYYYDINNPKKDALANYILYITEMKSKYSIEVEEAIKVLPTLKGSGIYLYKEDYKSNGSEKRNAGLFQLSMARKRAIMNAFQYSPIYFPGIDFMEDTNNNDETNVKSLPNKEQTDNNGDTKEIKKVKEEKEVKEVKESTTKSNSKIITDITNIINSYPQFKEDITYMWHFLYGNLNKADATPSQLIVFKTWVESVISYNKSTEKPPKDMIELGIDLITILKETTNAELIPMVTEKLKQVGYKTIYEIDDIVCLHNLLSDVKEIQQMG